MAQILTGSNTWWQGRSWADRDVQLRAAAQSGLDYQPGALTDIPAGSLVLLRGPRRVGKSVELKRHVQRLLDAGHEPRSLIHAAVDGWRSADLRMLVDVGKRLVPAGTERRTWLLDEVSSVPGWAEVVKNLRDTDSDFADDTVILTGSSAADLSEATKRLAGRRGLVAWPDRTLLPMGFRTFARTFLSSRDTPPPDVDRLLPADARSPRARRLWHELVPWLTDLTVTWEVYLQVGGFPQAVSAQLTGGDLGPVVQALADVVQRDALSSASLSSTQTTALMARLAVNLCSPVNARSVADDVGVAHDSINRRLDDLVAAFVMWSCFQGQRDLPRLRAQAKRYFTDPLLARLAHVRNPARPAPDATQLTEQQLGLAVLRSVEAAAPGSYVEFDQLLYARTPSRKEIDFVGPALGGVAIEGKYTDSSRWAAESATVDASSWAGVLATRSVLDTTATSEDRSWAVPAAFLAYAIDT